MKINILKLLIVALIVSTAVAGCKDERDNYMVDDSFSFVGTVTDLQQVTKLSVYDKQYEIPVLKNGKGRTSATALLDVSKTALDNYNQTFGTSYALLPESCYEFTQSISFSEKDFRKFAAIKWDPLAVTALDRNQTYVIPLELSAAGDALPVAENRNQKFIQLEFSSVSMMQTSTMSAADQDLIYNGQIGIDTPIATMDVEITYAIDNSLVDAYNAAHGTNYKSLPEGFGTLAATSSTIAASQTATTFSVRVPSAQWQSKIEAIKGGESFLLPVRISTVTEGVGVNEQTAYIPIEQKEVKGPWAVLEGNKIGYAFDPNPPAWSVAGYTAERLFDGVHANEWIPWFNTPNTFPMVFVADMADTHIFTKFVISDSFNYQGAARDYQIFVAETYNGANTKWTLVASGMRDYTWTDVGQNKDDPRLIYDYPVQKFAAGRYLKFVILKCEPGYGAASQAIGQCKLGDVQGVGL